MPRHKKDAATKHIEGSYRKDRDKTSDQETMANIVKRIPPPPLTLKTDYAREAWAAMVGPLCNMRRLCDEDMVTIQVAFESLDDAETFKTKLTGMDSDDPRIAPYASLVKNYRWQFVEIMRKYGTTLYDRMAMRSVLSGMKKKEKSLSEKMTE